MFDDKYTWYKLEGKCPHCNKEALEHTPGFSLRALGGIIKCTECSYRSSPSTYLAKSLFPVEPLPQGAAPIYYIDNDNEKDEEK